MEVTNVQEQLELLKELQELDKTLREARQKANRPPWRPTSTASGRWSILLMPVSGSCATSAAT
jgi:hypothetical protein